MDQHGAVGADHAAQHLRPVAAAGEEVEDPIAGLEGEQGDDLLGVSPGVALVIGVAACGVGVGVDLRGAGARR
ncbi:MAG: hypothetical protein KC457_03885 [Myxococcales bacterium]|nr:hypothetical protein [Myxococcales bacterium]